MNSDVRLEYLPLPRFGSTRDAGDVALLPIFNMPDRAVIAYEALPRGSAGCDDMSVLLGALTAAQYTAPAILLTSMPTELSRWPAAEIAQLAAQHAANPHDIAWLMSVNAGGLSQHEIDVMAADLRHAGFMIAWEANEWATDSHERIATMRPELLVLSAQVVATVAGRALAGAELAGLISFTSRLEVYPVARGVDDATIASALINAGLQHGCGAHLSPPLVLRRALAQGDDRVIGPAWFRQHEPRKLATRGREVRVATTVLRRSTDAVAEVGVDLFAKTLGEAARVLQGEHVPERILRVLGDVLQRVIPMSGLAIFEVDWERDILVPRVLAGSQAAKLRGLKCPMSGGITGWAFGRGIAYNCGNTTTHPAASTIPGTGHDQRPESLLVIPLIAGDHRLGVLDVWREGYDGFSDRDFEQCALFAHLAASAWENARLYRELEERVRTDALTGLRNTRWVDEVGTKTAMRYIGRGESVGVLLLDIDHFKLVNDRNGHAEGDRVLRDVARALCGAMRSSDEVVRFGGEEFLVMLYGTGHVDALRIAEQIRAAIAGMRSTVDGVRVTASIGVALLPAHGRTLETVIGVADSAMYQAKARGRNRVVVAPLNDPNLNEREAAQ